MIQVCETNEGEATRMDLEVALWVGTSLLVFICVFIYYLLMSVADSYWKPS